MKRYDLTIGYDPYMVETEEGDYVRFDDHNVAIADAVLAERRRVWGVLTEHLSAVESNMQAADTNKDISNCLSQKIAFVVLRDYLFPDGEPKEINPPAGERLDYEL